MAMNKHIYLNTAACGLIAPEVLAAGDGLYKGFEHNSSDRSEAWRFDDQPRIRGVIADFIGASTRNVAMVPNFSWAINGVIQSLKGTERVVLYKRDYPSLLEPFRANNFAITWIDTADGFNIDLEALKDAVTANKVDVVALSHVQWGSGYKLDLEAIGSLCKEHGVLFLVDATQSLGANVIDLGKLHIDVFAASNYKWMNVGFGTGVLYVSDSFLAKYPPVVCGYNSYSMINDELKYEPSVLSYEPGSPNMFGFTLLEAAIKHKNGMGMTEIERHDLALTAMLLNAIKELPIKILGDHTMTNRAPFVLIADENGLGDHVKRHGFVVTRRNGYLRVSTHFYNTEAEIAAFAECLRGFCDLAL